MTILKTIGIAFIATFILFFVGFIAVSISNFSIDLLNSFYDCGSHNPDGCRDSLVTGMLLMVFMFIFLLTFVFLQKHKVV